VPAPHSFEALTFLRVLHAPFGHDREQVDFWVGCDPHAPPLGEFGLDPFPPELNGLACVLDSLAGEPLRAWLMLFRDWKTLHAEPPPIPYRHRLKDFGTPGNRLIEALQRWSTEWNLSAHWITETAGYTLWSWTRADYTPAASQPFPDEALPPVNTLFERRLWSLPRTPLYVPPGPFVYDPPDDHLFPRSTRDDDLKEFETALRQDVAGRLDEYLREIREAVTATRYEPAPRAEVWIRAASVAAFQVLGMSAAAIEAIESLYSDRGTVHKAVMRGCRALGLTPRTQL